jgi:hypothetical protein
MMTQKNTVHTLHLISFKIHFNIIFPSMSISQDSLVSTAMGWMAGVQSQQEQEISLY